MTERSRTLAESMAVAVLKGDLGAARALADFLCETYCHADREVLPVKTLTCDRRNLRAVFSTYPSLGGDVTVSWDHLLRNYERWLNEGQPLALVGMHLDLYELPERTSSVPLDVRLPDEAALGHPGTATFR